MKKHKKKDKKKKKNKNKNKDQNKNNNHNKNKNKTYDFLNWKHLLDMHHAFIIGTAAHHTYHAVG